MNWFNTGRTVLDDIVERVRLRVSSDKVRAPVADLKSRIRDAGAVIPFATSLRSSFGLIAEIKRRSPSQGAMRHQHIGDIARIYNEHHFVRAISVLTNRDDFAMEIKDLALVRPLTSKPILRKDFIFDEYQIYEARAYGADAVLLMANVVTEAARLRGLFELARELGMDVLFECRSPEEIKSIPAGAQVYGINSRKLKAKKFLGFSRYTAAKMLRRVVPDRSIEHDIFGLARFIPPHAVKVAESGVSAGEIGVVRDLHHYNAALIGTSILNAPEGIQAAIDALDVAVNSTGCERRADSPAQHPVLVTH